MGNPTPSKSRASLLNLSVGGYVLKPEIKAALTALAARAVALDNQRRALLGQVGPSPFGLGLVAAGVVPPTALAGRRRAPGPRSVAPPAPPAPPGPKPKARATTPMVAAAADFLQERAQTWSDNLDYYTDFYGDRVQDGRRWLEQRPAVARGNLAPYAAGFRDYLEMVSKVDMADQGMPTPEQMRLREEARRNRPRPDYNTPYFQEIKRRREALHPLARQVDAGGRTFADTVAFGSPNYVAAFMDTLSNPYSFAQNLEGERYIDLLDSEDAWEGQLAGRVAGAFAPIGNKFVAAGKTLPAMAGRAAALEATKGFTHGAIATPGDLEDRLEGGVKNGFSDAIYAPLGPLAERGVVAVAPLASRQYPFLKDFLSTLASTAPKEAADFIAEADSRRVRDR